jgi:hypothetical protein
MSYRTQYRPFHEPLTLFLRLRSCEPLPPPLVLGLHLEALTFDLPPLPEQSPSNIFMFLYKILCTERARGSKCSGAERSESYRTYGQKHRAQAPCMCMFDFAEINTMLRPHAHVDISAAGMHPSMHWCTRQESAL